MAKYKIGITEAGDAGLDLSWKERLESVDGAILITKCVSPSFLKAVLEHKEKIIVHATFTGYGRSVVEPCVPPPYEEFDAILQLVKNGFPRERIVIRIDPIIPIRYLSDKIKPLQYIGGKSDWIDLRAAEEVDMKKGDFKMIPLGVAMQLPTGYEAHMIPRSSTFKNFGIIQANHMGMIDESYCGDNDQWHFPAIAMRDTVIHVGDRICQFRIDKHQPQLSFEAVETLGNADRGGFGTTGKR